MSDWGIKVSKSGVPVLLATPKQLYYSSAYDSLKVESVNVVSLTLYNTDVATRTYTFAHGLGYVPAFFAVMETLTAGKYIPIPWTDPGLVIYNQIQAVDVRADGTNIYFDMSPWGGGPTETVDVIYWIMYNQLN